MQSKIISKIIIACLIISSLPTQAQVPDSMVLKDLVWDKAAPAGQLELTIPSENSKIAGFMYSANGVQKHPTLILLHGFPGNERNLDLAQIVRAHGWNVIYFNYSGSWGSEGKFSFENCVQDAKNVVSFCKKYADLLRIDTADIVFFGHSMGGFVCLKALSELPDIKKGFALSTWNIYGDLKPFKPSQASMIAKMMGEYFVLNTPTEEIIKPVLTNPAYYNLSSDTSRLSNKQIIMLDENIRNGQLANTLKSSNHNYFDYEVWQTDHPFSNKRISMINKVLEFLNKD